jgi:uncharacterized membrane protein YphA (DoxX/SURF4 family)
MKIAMIIVRTLMGLMFLSASIPYFIMKFPAPAGQLKIYMDGITLVHIMPIVKVIELLCAICFVSGRFVTLAVVVLFPIIINIILLDSFLDPSHLPPILAILIADLFLAYYYRNNYKTLFAVK